MKTETELFIEKAFALGAVAHMTSALPKNKITNSDLKMLDEVRTSYPDECDEMGCNIHGVGMRLFWTGVAEGIAAVIDTNIVNTTLNDQLYLINTAHASLISKTDEANRASSPALN